MKKMTWGLEDLTISMWEKLPRWEQNKIDSSFNVSVVWLDNKYMSGVHYGHWIRAILRYEESF